jgi:two-component system response regulator YesN
MLKLLMVDDEQWVRERFAERIPWADAGFRFIGAASGAEEAIRMMERETPDLLLTDITMPNMNGLELTSYVRKRWPKVRIIILTAYGEFEFARQAIGLGVDNYLIKLAQTPEQLLEACRKVAEEIEQEMDVEQKLEMRRKLQWEKEWASKRHWTDHMINDTNPQESQRFPSEWLEELHQVGYLVGLTLGWKLPGAVGRAERFKEEWEHLQRQIGEALEQRLDQRYLGNSCRMTLLPIGPNRIHILISSKQPLEAFRLNQLAMAILEVAKTVHETNGFIYVGSTSQIEKHSLTVGQVAEGLRLGLDGVASYFYNQDSPLVGRSMAAIQRIDAEQARERIAQVMKAIQREAAEMFQEAAAVMTKLTDPATHPEDLLQLTRQIFHPGLMKLPPAVMERLDEITHLETWQQYCAWWEDIVLFMSEWLNNRVHPAATIRREVQAMCRHIREHYKEEVQVAELAELVHLHPSYAGQLFKQEIGENVSEYLNRVRMEKASELLERTSMKIYEVSGAVGISDYRYFCKLFKSYTGSTPTQYKKK